MSFMPAGYVWNRRNVGWFIHTMTIGASGAISAQDPAGDSGVIAAKQSQAGRYLCTLPTRGFRKFHGGFAILVGDATNAYGATTVGGPDAIIRAEHIDDATNPPTVLVQFIAGASNNDADLPSGTVVHIHICVGF